MKILHRFRSTLLLWSLVGVALTSVVGLAYKSQDRLPEQLRQQALQHGCIVEFGLVDRGLFKTTVRNARLRCKNAAGITVTVDEMVVRGTLIGAPQVTFERSRFSLTGEPMALYESLLSISEWEGLPVTAHGVSVEYAHKMFGSMLLEDPQLEQRDDSTIVRARQAKLGAARWQNVFFSVRRRNQMIEVGLSDTSVKTALVQLGYFPSTSGASQWTFTAKHQPARRFGQRLGWDPGPEFDASYVVGSLSFIVPDDQTLAIRGSLQLALDRWPKPNCADADALLGNTASFAARIEPSDDMSRWDLPNADVSLSLFSMQGVGRIRLGHQPTIMLDVKGTRTCAQINGNLPPSSYLNQVKQYLEQTPTPAATARGTDRLREEVPLRLQLVAENAANGRRNVAWHLQPGCGLPELSVGSFLALEMPAHVKKMHNPQAH